jgi:quinol monooxygenase YgiN
MVRVGLLVRLKAKTGRELDVENFLREGLAVVDDEPETTVWFALRLAPDTFAIFDTFPDDSGRDAHLSGRLASELMDKASELLAEPPAIERTDVLAGKLPGFVVSGVGAESSQTET